MAIQQFGASWPDGTPSLKIHLACIRKGGQWTDDNGTKCGLGLYEHYKCAMQLIWPSDDWHRWVDLEVKTIAENIITVIMGPADSGKTFIAGGKWALVEYWASPKNTLVVVSSTDMRGLELRVWGAIKQLFNRAVDLHPHLSGRPLESMHCITTDEIDEEQERARTLNRGIVCVPCLQGGRYTGVSKYFGVKAPRLRQVSDECFPSGTLVDTPDGPAKIEKIISGDIVTTAIGPRRVILTSKRLTDAFVRVLASDGRQIVCTPEHPFFTQYGWVKACELNQCHYMVSPHESLQILREENTEQEFLREELRREICDPESNQKEGVLYRCSDSKNSRNAQNGIQISPREIFCDVPENFGENSQKNERDDPRGEASDAGANQQVPSSHWVEASNSRGKRNRPDESREAAALDDSGVRIELRCKNRSESGQWVSGVLQTGCSDSKPEIRSGGRWGVPQSYYKKGSGCKEDGVFVGAWVDSVEILKQEDFRDSTSGEGGTLVHNLQIEGHPSYSVNGLLVHNCALMGESHLDALPNYMGKDYKGVFLGNPMDPLDPLGRIGEPENGWASLPEPTKTTTWKTRMLGGTCVNLVGTDSPNFDYPQDEPVRFPYLINWKKLKAVKDFWGAESQQYYSQCVGVMKTGLLNKRVITRDMCREHHALDRAFWKGEKRTKIYAIDAAYSGVGGDRCVAGYVEFGESESGTDIVRINKPKIIPISIRIEKSPEDQIAEFVKREMEIESIPTQNCFYDSTGRGTLGSAFARVFGNITPVPVEFGGRPTKRPVRQDLYIEDEKDGRRRRHKRCDEHYYDFVSELWFSSRYVIEADQMRELPEDVMLEGCQREYGTAPGNKLFVESKHDPECRKRMRVSPDLYDWLCTALEGCRQRGFKIQRLGAVFVEKGDQFKWLKQNREKHHKLVTSKALAYK